MKKKISSSKSEQISSYILLIPTLILLGVMVLYPLIQTAIFSLYRIDLLKFSERTFIGLKNYIELFKDSEFIRSLTTSIIFTIVVVPIQCILAFLIAILLENTFKFRGLFRTIFFIPYITSTVATAIIFMKLFTQDGLLSKFFSFFGLPNTTWYTNLDLALPFLAFIYIWTTLGFYIVLFSTGLNTIPEELYDAAKIDGANNVQTIRFITIPVLKPFIFLILSTAIISAFQVFDQAYVLARGASLGSPAGATMTLPVFVYAQAFRYNRVDHGAAAAMILLLLVLTITMVLRGRFSEDSV